MADMVDFSFRVRKLVFEEDGTHWIHRGDLLLMLASMADCPKLSADQRRLLEDLLKALRGGPPGDNNSGGAATTD